MTIDEAIMHCMDIAETQEMCSNGKKCAKEHRQLAEWLKELKALREVCVSEAFDMAIEALGQTDVLDKIRAEIMDFEEELFHRPNTDYADYAAVRHCVEIIDKYKAESEDEE